MSESENVSKRDEPNATQRNADSVGLGGCGCEFRVGLWKGETSKIETESRVTSPAEVSVAAAEKFVPCKNCVRKLRRCRQRGCWFHIRAGIVERGLHVSAPRAVEETEAFEGCVGLVVEDVYVSQSVIQRMSKGYRVEKSRDRSMVGALQKTQHWNRPERWTIRRTNCT
jgi:hypothetical protein